MDTKQKAWIYANENPDNIEPASTRRHKREPNFIGRMNESVNKMIATFGEEKYLRMLDEDKITGAEKDARNERVIKENNL